VTSLRPLFFRPSLPLLRRPQGAHTPYVHRSDRLFTTIQHKTGLRAGRRRIFTTIRRKTGLRPGQRRLFTTIRRKTGLRAGRRRLFTTIRHKTGLRAGQRRIFTTIRGKTGLRAGRSRIFTTIQRKTELRAGRSRIFTTIQRKTGLRAGRKGSVAGPKVKRPGSEGEVSPVRSFVRDRGRQNAQNAENRPQSVGKIRTGDGKPTDRGRKAHG